MPSATWAQIVEDHTTRTRVESCGNRCINISEGTQGGRNLFHSFSKFSPGRNTVRFTNNNSAIQNVIGRVTGSSASRIDGLIEARGTSPHFNLFLLNPNGIILGPNARLDIRGSFVATTANAIQFGNQGFFSAADLSQNPALLTINPSAFLFNQVKPQPIVYQFDPNRLDFTGTNDPSTTPGAALPGIEVPEGERILFLGGDIYLNGGGDVDQYVGTLSALGGGIEIGAVAEPGTVELTTRGDRLHLSIPSDTALGDISLTGAVGVRAANGGDIYLFGRHITLTDGSRVSVSVFEDPNPGGSLTVTASESVRLSGTAQNGFSSGFFAQPAQPFSGRGGDLSITTQRLIVQDGAEITTTTLSNNPAGQLLIKASDVYLSGVAAIPNDNGIRQSSGLFSGTRGEGRSGNAGLLRVETRRLIVRNGARVSASSFEDSTGRGGDLTVLAEFVLLEGTDPELGRSGLLVGTTGSGNAGNLRVNTGQLVVRGGAQISAQSLGEGQSGRISIRASQSVQVSGASALGEPSRIATEAFSTGNAGRLNLTTRQLALEDGAELSTQTAFGNGGDINLQVQDLLLLRHRGQISTTAGIEQGAGNGGNITINAANGTIVAVPGENSDITANAFEGNGGNIDIAARSLLGLRARDKLTPLSDITASSEFGLNGNVQIRTPDVDPTQGLTEFPVELATPTIQQRCYVRNIASTSEFINSGRGGLPPGPDAIRNRDLVWDDLRPPSSNPSAHPVDRPLSSLRLPPLPPNPEPIAEAQGWVVGAQGQVMLIAQSPSVTAGSSYRSWQVSPPCPAS